MTELTNDERKTLIRMLRLSGADDASSEIKAIDLVNATIKGWAGCITEPFWDIWVKWFDSFGDTWDFPSRVAALMNKEQPEQRQKIIEDAVNYYCSKYTGGAKFVPTKDVDDHQVDSIGSVMGVNTLPFYQRTVADFSMHQYQYRPQDYKKLNEQYKNIPFIELSNEPCFGPLAPMKVQYQDDHPKPKYPPAPASFRQQLDAVTEVDPFPRIGWPGRPEE